MTKSSSNDDHTVSLGKVVPTALLVLGVLAFAPLHNFPNTLLNLGPGYRYCARQLDFFLMNFLFH